MFRHAFRALSRNPKFTAAAVLTLALAIGANSAIYSLVNALLLRPLPGVQEPGRLVTLKRLQLNNPDYVFGYPDYLDYRSRVTMLSGLAAHIRCSLVGRNAEKLRGDLVSANYFQLLGVQPVVGRLLDSGDKDAASVAVLSYGFWQRSFAASAHAIGAVIELGGHSYTVVGVAGPRFQGTVPGAPVDVWLPLTMQPYATPRLSSGILQSRTAGWLNIFGRLRPGTGIEPVRAELKTIAAQLARAWPQTNEHRGVDVVSGLGLDPDDKAVLTAFFRLLLGAVGAILLIACANVAGLLLIRASARHREIAIRCATGASRGQIVGQLLTEGLLLSLLAGTFGLLLAAWAAKLLLSFRQPLYPTTGLDVTPDWNVVAFTLLISLAAGIGFSLGPARQLSQASLVTAIKARSQAHSLLIALQVAISLVLLVGAGLAVRSLRNVLSSDLGFTARNLLLLPVDLGSRSGPELLNRVRALPGVEAASFAFTVPPRDYSSRISVFYPGQAPSAEELRGHEFELGIRVDTDTVAPDFFRTMGIPLQSGRDFSVRDTAASPRVAVLSEALARRLWPGENPIGRSIEVPSPVQIVGVVRDIKYRSLLLPPPLLIYVPLAQNPDPRQTLVVRTTGDPSGLLTSLRGTDLPLSGARTLSDEIAESLWQQEMAARLIGALGLLALLLAGVGVYGVTAHWVAQGTHDIGIRMALGARRSHIMRMVLGRGFFLTLLGLALGIPAALGANRFLSGLLYGTTTDDPFTFLAVALLVAGAALAATSVPAHRATLVDPVVALRCE